MRPSTTTTPEPPPPPAQPLYIADSDAPPTDEDDDTDTLGQPGLDRSAGSDVDLEWALSIERGDRLTPTVLLASSPPRRPSLPAPPPPHRPPIPTSPPPDILAITGVTGVHGLGVDQPDPAPRPLSSSSLSTLSPVQSDESADEQFDVDPISVPATNTALSSGLSLSPPRAGSPQSDSSLPDAGALLSSGPSPVVRLRPVERLSVRIARSQPRPISDTVEQSDVVSTPLRPSALPTAPSGPSSPAVASLLEEAITQESPSDTPNRRWRFRSRTALQLRPYELERQRFLMAMRGQSLARTTPGPTAGPAVFRRSGRPSDRHERGDDVGSEREDEDDEAGLGSRVDDGESESTCSGGTSSCSTSDDDRPQQQPADATEQHDRPGSGSSLPDIDDLLAGPGGRQVSSSGRPTFRQPRQANEPAGPTATNPISTERTKEKRRTKKQRRKKRFKMPAGFGRPANIRDRHGREDRDSSREAQPEVVLIDSDSNPNPAYSLDLSIDGTDDGNRAVGTPSQGRRQPYVPLGLVEPESGSDDHFSVGRSGSVEFDLADLPDDRGGSESARRLAYHPDDDGFDDVLYHGNEDDYDAYGGEDDIPEGRVPISSDFRYLNVPQPRNSSKPRPRSTQARPLGRSNVFRSQKRKVQPGIESFMRPSQPTESPRLRSSKRKLTDGSTPRSTNPRPSRRKAPRLSIVDVPDSELKTTSGDIPDFIRLARRNARRAPGKGRHSPDGKIIRLQREDETADAMKSVRAWRAGRFQSQSRTRSAQVGDGRPRRTQVGDGQPQHRPARSNTRPWRPKLRPPAAPRRTGVLKWSGQIEVAESSIPHASRLNRFRAALIQMDKQFDASGGIFGGAKVRHYLHTQDQSRVQDVDRPKDDAVQMTPSAVPDIPHSVRPTGRKKRPTRRLDVSARTFRQPDDPAPVSPPTAILVDDDQDKPRGLIGLRAVGDGYPVTFDVEPLDGPVFEPAGLVGPMLKRVVGIRVDGDGDVDMDSPSGLAEGELHGKLDPTRFAVRSPADVALTARTLRDVLLSIVSFSALKPAGLSQAIYQAVATLIPPLSTLVGQTDHSGPAGLYSILSSCACLLHIAIVLSTAASTSSAAPLLGTVSAYTSDLELVLGLMVRLALVADFSRFSAFLDSRKEVFELAMADGPVEAIVVMGVLARKNGIAVWPLIYPAIQMDKLAPPLSSASPKTDAIQVASLERIWQRLFALLPVLAVGPAGIADRDARAEPGWSRFTVVAATLALVPASDPVKASVYVTALLRRIDHLVRVWRWDGDGSINQAKAVFDFFAARRFGPLPGERGGVVYTGWQMAVDLNSTSNAMTRMMKSSAYSAPTVGPVGLLALLAKQQSVACSIPTGRDCAFSVFAKTTILILSRLNDCAVAAPTPANTKAVQNAVWRFIPLYRRALPLDGEPSVTTADVDALAARVCLVAALMVGVPAGKVGYHVLERIVDFSGIDPRAGGVVLVGWEAVVMTELARLQTRPSSAANGDEMPSRLPAMISHLSTMIGVLADQARESVRGQRKADAGTAAVDGLAVIAIVAGRVVRHARPTEAGVILSNLRLDRLVGLVKSVVDHPQSDDGTVQGKTSVVTGLVLAAALRAVGDLADLAVTLVDRLEWPSAKPATITVKTDCKPGTDGRDPGDSQEFGPWPGLDELELELTAASPAKAKTVSSAVAAPASSGPPTAVVDVDTRLATLERTVWECSLAILDRLSHDGDGDGGGSVGRPGMVVARDRLLGRLADTVAHVRSARMMRQPPSLASASFSALVSPASSDRSKTCVGSLPSGIGATGYAARLIAGVISRLWPGMNVPPSSTSLSPCRSGATRQLAFPDSDLVDAVVLRWLAALTAPDPDFGPAADLTVALVRSGIEHPAIGRMPFMKKTTLTTSVSASAVARVTPTMTAGGTIGREGVLARRVDVLAAVMAGLRDAAEQPGLGNLVAVARRGRLALAAREVMAGLKRAYPVAVGSRQTRQAGRSGRLAEESRHQFVAFVHAVVEVLEQVAAHVEQVDPFFLNGTNVPLPESDPDFVVARLRRLAGSSLPTLSVPVKSAHAGVNSVLPSATAAEKQPASFLVGLIEQAVVAVSNGGDGSDGQGRRLASLLVRAATTDNQVGQTGPVVRRVIVSLMVAAIDTLWFSGAEANRGGRFGPGLTATVLAVGILADALGHILVPPFDSRLDRSEWASLVSVVWNTAGRLLVRLAGIIGPDDLQQRQGRNRSRNLERQLTGPVSGQQDRNPTAEQSVGPAVVLAAVTVLELVRAILPTVKYLQDIRFGRELSGLCGRDRKAVPDGVSAMADLADRLGGWIIASAPEIPAGPEQASEERVVEDPARPSSLASPVSPSSLPMFPLPQYDFTLAQDLLVPVDRKDPLDGFCRNLLAPMSRWIPTGNESTAGWRTTTGRGQIMVMPKKSGDGSERADGLTSLAEMAKGVVDEVDRLWWLDYGRGDGMMVVPDLVDWDPVFDAHIYARDWQDKARKKTAAGPT